MKAVIYARYSSDNQREESIEGQIRECTAFAEKNDITILKHYIDRAFSAKTDNRPEFQNMIKDSAQGLFDVIIVWKLDRFARNRYDSAHYKHLLRKNGVKVISATEAISEGAEGIILESVLEGYAEYYSVDLSEKIRRGQTENALKCVSNGAPSPLGYKLDENRHFVIDPLTAPFVVEAFEKYSEGMTITQLIKYLNDRGCKNTKGSSMKYNAVEKMLKNRRYLGEYRYGDIVVPDGMPAIISEELFNRVQEKMAANRKAPARHKAEDDYILTTKLFCGHCGKYMCGESGTSKTLKVHHYYKCGNAKKGKTCNKKTVRKEWIENLVVNETMNMIMDDNALEAIIDEVMALQDQENINIPILEKELADTEKSLKNVMKAIEDGIVTKTTKERLEELEQIKSNLEEKIIAEQFSNPKISQEFLEFSLQQYRKLDIGKLEDRKMLIDAFVNSIYLYDDKIVLTFNYKGSTKRIPLDAVNDILPTVAMSSNIDCLTPPLKICVKITS